MVYWGILKTALEAFYFGPEQPEAFLLPSSQFKNNHPTRPQLLVFQDFFFQFQLYFSTDNYFAFLAFQVTIPIQMPKFPSFLNASMVG